jgi:predicted metal-binding membrane protein
VTALTHSPARRDLAPAYAAVRARLSLVLVLFALAAAGWAWTANEMRGMDDGPWTSLGGFGWFVGVWVVMMAAMMFPSVAPTVALFARMRQTSRSAPYLFAGGYLLTWAVAGVAAYAVGAVATHASGAALTWHRGGRVVAGVTLLAAAVYEVTPLKDVCLGKCRSPLGALLGSWRDGAWGAIRMGARNGAWCVGCCWALMASLFALGVMSVPWMAFIAAVIAVEKTLPWRRVGLVIAAVLLALGGWMLAAPDTLPGLTVPGGMHMSSGHMG